MSSSNGLLDAAKLFARSERRYATVRVGDHTARLRSLTAAEMRRLRDSLYTADNKPETARMNRVAELLIIHTLVDADGQPVLTEGQLSEFDQLDAKTVSALGQAALDHTGWRAEYDMASVTDAKKNSDETAGDE